MSYNKPRAPPRAAPVKTELDPRGPTALIMKRHTVQVATLGTIWLQEFVSRMCAAVRMEDPCLAPRASLTMPSTAVTVKVVTTLVVPVPNHRVWHAQLDTTKVPETLVGHHAHPAQKEPLCKARQTLLAHRVRQVHLVHTPIRLGKRLALLIQH